jgi:hypothetical protein
MTTETGSVTRGMGASSTDTTRKTLYPFQIVGMDDTYDINTTKALVWRFFGIRDVYYCSNLSGIYCKIVIYKNLYISTLSASSIDM